MTEHTVARTDELDDGDRLLVEVEGGEIVVFNVDGEYVAYTNWCAHQAGPVCEGTLTGTWDADFDREELEVGMELCREGEILSCPWHGWEYDVVDGSSLTSDARLPAHPVRVERDDIVVRV
ncbi:Rieske (2Fe-2S) protein [Halogeometricum limi]|uniref:Ferredoxin subunit of nitrite reductase or a ring-hydroxylating dioxygenase n=1 Tax=Halogeometricum limi TaxID=555875 RepID=A0A1I6IET3_9EURY|nr:Rieske (2Fe-2S) protein [Halogeometricum limi]SFR64860.1 Ferredoxin subunit of nitrite reductase or a ring-hydroxylating dioxygenase [Halogeometricum limi]